MTSTLFVLTFFCYLTNGEITSLMSLSSSYLDTIASLAESSLSHPLNMSTFYNNDGGYIDRRNPYANTGNYIKITNCNSIPYVTEWNTSVCNGTGGNETYRMNTRSLSFWLLMDNLSLNTPLSINISGTYYNSYWDAHACGPVAYTSSSGNTYGTRKYFCSNGGPSVHHLWITNSDSAFRNGGCSLTSDVDSFVNVDPNYSVIYIVYWLNMYTYSSKPTKSWSYSNHSCGDDSEHQNFFNHVANIFEQTSIPTFHPTTVPTPPTYSPSNYPTLIPTPPSHVPTYVPTPPTFNPTYEPTNSPIKQSSSHSLMLFVPYHLCIVLIIIFFGYMM